MTTAPAQIGHFRIGAEIGRGGMGVVYHAHDSRLDRDVAIKAISPELARDPERLARFKREARIVAQLNSPHVAQIYQVLEGEGTTYLVLEYVPGRTLAEMIGHGGALEPAHALSICAQVARALEEAHARGIVHRDLKPGNVRVAPDGTAKVLDFGIAVALAASPAHSLPDDTTVLAELGSAAAPGGAMAGTAGYMAPEQVRGLEIDSRADVFAFGCLLYECLTGVPAFAGDTPVDAIAATLTTEPEQSLLPAALPDGVRAVLEAALAKDVGDRLQSIAEARAVLDAAIGRGTETPTPVRRAADVVNNLPQPLTSFIGRDQELRDLPELLAKSRLVTLTGAGGCGKTRLALEIAWRVMNRFPDGVFLVELASTCCPEFVPRAVATTLGVKDRAGKTTTEALGEHLASKTVLLLLDNCEHLVDEASELTVALLRIAPGLHVLATSREPLGAPGEALRRVASLPLPEESSRESIGSSESVALFLDRARLVQPALTLDDGSGETIARICRRLDGIPLAIELAAARMKVLTPDELERRLDDRFRVLTGGPSAGLAHHRTLRMAVDWSYRTLDEGERRMLRRLSVFVGGLTLDGAFALGGPGGRIDDGGGDLDEFEVLDLLTRLANKSLIVVDQEGTESRYRLLETLREYAAEKLVEAGEERDARDHHLDFFLALAEDAAPRLTGSGQAAWLTRLEAGHENVLAALDRCGAVDGGAVKALRLCRAMMRFWQYHGHFRVGVAACDAALALPEAQERTALRAGALHAAGIMAYMLGAYDDAVRRQSEALEIWRERGDRPGIADTLNGLGNVAYYRGDLADAARYHEESLAIRRELGDKPGVATSLNNLANVASDRGNAASARKCYEEALAINRETDNRAWEAVNLNNLGLLAQNHGDLLEAEPLHEEALALRGELGDRHGIAESIAHLGDVARRRGDLESARSRHGESLSTRRELGDKLGVTDSLDGCAHLAAALSRPEDAARLLGAAERLRGEIGAPRPQAEQRAIDALVNALCETMGADDYEVAVAGGRAISLDAAVAEAMAWLGPTP